MTRAVGIDLGTTHTVVAWARLEGDRPPDILPIPQHTTATEIGALPHLPSCLYSLGAGDPIPDGFAVGDWIAGEFARRRGAEVPSRSVSSAKSWLCYSGVDRQAPILPWGVDEEGSALPRISPVDASSRYLSHVARAWDAAFPSEPLAEQDIVLTVPASFDEASRSLTLEAARRAGITPRLLEEPLAAFYDCLTRVGPAALARLAAEPGDGDLVLVCDVGGGTTDLSLIRVAIGSEGEPTFERVAVGRHLLLGGDNMDLALAHAVEHRMVPPPDRLDPSRFGELVQACRLAKERLFSDGAPPACPVTILGRGTRLFGNVLSAQLTADDLARIVLEGFFPPCPPGASRQAARGGLVAFGLPYERDVGITRHIAQFLSRHAPGRTPAALLLNGGVFRAAPLVRRIAEVVGSFGGTPLTVLPNPDPDLAVARGAVAYARARRGFGARVCGGASRGYYVGLAGPKAKLPQAICVVPRGAEEGVTHVAAGKPVALVLGRPVRFDLFASAEATDRAGDVVSVDEDRFERLPPVAVTFDRSGAGPQAAPVTASRPSSRPPGEEVHVELQGELTALGTLELACVEVTGAVRARHFRLEFQLRPDQDSDGEPAAAQTRPTVSKPPPAQRLAEAEGAMLRVFGKGRADVGPREARNLIRELERILGDRGEWTMETARALFDVLGQDVRARKRSSDHERTFWMVAGFCLRPGFGHPLDAARVALLEPLLPEKLAFPSETRAWQQLWIALRRVAGGLTEPTQEALRDILDPFLAPTEERLKPLKGWKGEPPDDVLDLASQLERVAPTRRSRLGGWILERTWTSREPRLWAALGRIGARAPSYASAHHVVPPSVAERWIDHLLREKWNDLPTAPQAAVQLARVTGDRARDVSPRVRAELARRLSAVGAKAEWIRAVEEYVPLPEAERIAFFGETLPLGLRLVDSREHREG